MLNAGVIDQNIHATELALGVGDHLGNLRGVTDVRRMVADLATKLADFGNHCRRIAKTVENQIGPSLAVLSAMPRPMPLVEPVTSAVLPERVVMNTSHNASGVESADHYETAVVLISVIQKMSL